MGFLTRCKRLFSFAFLLQNRNTFFSFFLKSFLILSEKQHSRKMMHDAVARNRPNSVFKQSPADTGKHRLKNPLMRFATKVTSPCLMLRNCNRKALLYNNKIQQKFLVPSFCAERQIQIKYGICHNLHGIHEFFLKSASRFLFPAHLFYHLFLLSEHLE